MSREFCATMAQVFPVFLLIVAVRDGFLGTVFHDDALRRFYGSAYILIFVCAEFMFVLGAAGDGIKDAWADLTWWTIAFVLFLTAIQLVQSFWDRPKP